MNKGIIAWISANAIAIIAGVWFLANLSSDVDDLKNGQHRHWQLKQTVDSLKLQNKALKEVLELENPEAFEKYKVLFQ